MADGSLHYVKLGSGRSAPIRIVNAARDLGLESERKTGRDRRKAEAEMHRYLARMGGKS